MPVGRMHWIEQAEQSGRTEHSWRGAAAQNHRRESKAIDAGHTPDQKHSEMLTSTRDPLLPSKTLSYTLEIRFNCLHNDEASLFQNMNLCDYFLYAMVLGGKKVWSSSNFTHSRKASGSPGTIFLPVLLGSWIQQLRDGVVQALVYI